MIKIVSLFIALGIEDYMLPCFTKKIFGIDCPGCGLQRGLAFMLKGDFAAAWNMYPALFAILPLFALLAADHFFKIKYANKLITILMIASVALILTNYIFKFI